MGFNHEVMSDLAGKSKKPDMSARDIIFDYFSYKDGDSSDLESLMGYLDTDTLVAWFVDEGYIDDLDNEKETEVIMNHYELHCGGY